MHRPPPAAARGELLTRANLTVLTIVGARPQFIKAAPVSRALRATAGVREILVHTGQHYDENMSDVFFDELEIPRPDHNLGVGSGSHGVQTGRILAALDPLLQMESPDWVLVYGDTNSTLAGALAASKLHLPVAHVEAGLRSFNRRMPEEINRIVADHTSDLLLAPTAAAMANLRSEGLPEERMALVGDVMLDAALQFSRIAETRSTILERLGLSTKGYMLATVHRAENTDDPNRLSTILEGLATAPTSLPVVLPLHPRTRRSIADTPRAEFHARRIRIIEPLGYLDMVMLEKNARLVATDSGGVQKEAYFFRVPCVTLREETEWVELVELGWNRLAPPHDVETLTRAIQQALAEPPRDADEPSEPQPYGDGHASEKIRDLLLRGRA